MKIIIYNPLTGSIGQYMSFPDDEYDEFIANNVPIGKEYIVVKDFPNFELSYIDSNKQLCARERQPTPYHRWLNYQWVLDSAAQYKGEAENTRVMRDKLLTDSDWTDTLSSKNRLGEDLYNQWQAYRQALRDVPEQAGFPLSIIWPTPPA